MTLRTVRWEGNTAAATLPAGDASLTAGALTANSGVTLGVATLTQYAPNEVWTATHSAARTTLAAAVTAGGYHSVAISRPGGLVPKAIRLKAARGGATSPRGFAIRSSVDNYTANLLSVADVATVRATLTQHASGDLTSLGAQTAITFRIYHFAPAATSAVDFDDLEFDYDDASATLPTVSAGADVASHPVNAAFTRTATENNGGAAITGRLWKIQSGPAGVGNTIGTAAALSWTPTVTGTYVLRYTATNSVGTSAPDDMSITVITPPLLRIQDQIAVNDVAAATVVTSITGGGSGRALVALISLRASTGSSVTGVTDSAGNTWTFASMGRHASSAARIEIWYCLNAAPVTSVTATLEAAVKAAMNVSEWQGVRTALAIEGVADTGGAGTALTSGPITTTVEDVVVIGAVTSTTTGTRTLDAGAGFTALTAFRTTGGSDTIATAAYRITTATGTYHATWTEDASRNFGGAAIALRGLTEGPGSGPPPALSRQAFPITVGADTLEMGYYSTAAIETTDTAPTRAILTVHGISRTGLSMAQYTLDAADLQGVTATTRIIAPHFPLDSDLDAGDTTTLYWPSGDWSEGLPSGTGSGNLARGFQMSSFEVMDRLILAARAAMPNLTEIVVVGHSAGGQLAQRYAATTDINADPAMDIPVRFVVANPGSYVYLDSRRPNSAGTVFATPTAGEISAAPGYNTWKYGLQGTLPPYVAARSATIPARFSGHTVTYLLGDADNDPGDPDLDTSPEANLQGAHRYDRSTKFFDYLSAFYAPRPASHSKLVVPGVGHDPELILASANGRTALFVPPAAGPTAAAALGGSGALAATPLPTWIKAAALGGSGALAATPLPTWIKAASLGGSGALAAALGQTTGTQPAALSSAGNLTAGSKAAFIKAAALSGAGTLTTTQLIAVARAAALAGAGTLSAASKPGWIKAAALSGSGQLFAEAFGFAHALLSGAGALTTTQQAALSRAAALSSTGTLTAAQFRIVAALAAALSGAGTLTVVTPTVPIGASLTGEGHLSTFAINLLRIGSVTPSTIRVGGIMPSAIYLGTRLVWKP